MKSDRANRASTAAVHATHACGIRSPSRAEDSSRRLGWSANRRSVAIAQLQPGTLGKCSRWGRDLRGGRRHPMR